MRGGGLGIGLMLAAAFAIDRWLIPARDVPVLYTIPILLSARRRSPGDVLLVAGAALGLFVVNSLTTPAAELALWPLGAGALLMVGYLAHLLAWQREETARRVAEAALGSAARERAEAARHESETRMRSEGGRVG